MEEPGLRHTPEHDGIKTRHPRFVSLDRGCTFHNQELWGLLWRACNPSYSGGCGRRLEGSRLAWVAERFGGQLGQLSENCLQASKQKTSKKVAETEGQCQSLHLACMGALGSNPSPRGKRTCVGSLQVARTGGTQKRKHKHSDLKMYSCLIS